jgi:hypothetical protein
VHTVKTSAATPFFSHAQAPIVFNVTVLKGKFLPGGHHGSTCIHLTLRVSRKVLHDAPSCIEHLSMLTLPFHPA